MSAEIERLRAALSRDPDDARTHATLALELVRVRRIAGAVHEAELAVRLDVAEPFCHRALAAARHAQHRHADAWSHARIAIQDDRDLDARVLAAAIRSAQGDRAMARLLIAEVLAIDAGHLDALVARAGFDLADGNLTDARRRIATVIAVEPLDLAARALAARIAIAAGDLVTAEAHARFALSRDAEHRDALEVWMTLKRHRSIALGAWWRLNGFVTLRSERGRIALLIGTFVLVRVAVIVAAGLGFEQLETSIQTAWLAFCVYSWTAPTLFRWMLRREIQTVQL